MQEHTNHNDQPLFVQRSATVDSHPSEAALSAAEDEIHRRCIQPPSRQSSRPGQTERRFLSTTNQEVPMMHLEVTDSALKQLTEIMKENIDQAIRLFVQGIG